MSRYTLPSGMIGEVRGLTGRDGRYLTNEHLAKDNESIEDFILSNCWTATLDAGPYAFKGEKADWNRALIGDRFYLLIAVREETYPGEDYTMKVQCTQRGCKKRFAWDISLGKLLEEKTRRLTPEDVETFKQGNVFRETIPFTSTGFTFKLLTGGEAKAMQKHIQAKKTGTKAQQERQNLMIDALAHRIVEIDGVPKKRDSIFDALEDMPLRTIDATLKLVEGHDCGVETDIDVTCTHCGTDLTIALPFDRAFFLPYSATKDPIKKPGEDEGETDD